MLKTLGVQLRASMPALEKGWGSVARSSRANYGGDCNCLEVVSLNALVLSLVNIDKCTHLNSEPEKCYPTKRTIGSLLPKINTKKPRHPPWLFPTHQLKTTSFSQPCNHLHPFAIDFLRKTCYNINDYKQLHRVLMLWQRKRSDTCLLYTSPEKCYPTKRTIGSLLL